MTCLSTDKSDRGNRDPFVDDRDPVLEFDLFANPDKILCRTAYFFIDSGVEPVQISITAVEKADTKRDRSNIEHLLLDHFIGFVDFENIDHACLLLRYGAFFRRSLHAGI